MHEKVGIGEGFWFISMMVSAAAMDSENPVIPGSICLVSALALLWISRKKSLRQQAQKLGIRKYFISVLIIARRGRESKMVYQIENRMALDPHWPELLPEPEKPEETRDAGWEEIVTGFFVHEEDAYSYAIERLSQDSDLKQEFVEWFYSGNWIREDGIGTTFINYERED